MAAIPSYDDNNHASTSGTDTLTFSLTVGGRENRLLLVSVASRSGVAVSTITYAGLTLTQLRSDQPGADIRSEIWYYKDPPAGTANVVVTMASSATFAADAAAFYGVHQTSTFGTHTSATGTGTAASVTATTVVNEMVMDFVAIQGVAGTIDRDLSQRTLGSNGATVSMGKSIKPAISISTVMAWTITSLTWVHTATPIKPDGLSEPTYVGAV